MVDANPNGLIQGADDLKRCWWCGTDDQYMRYHDEEWGRPVDDDFRLFEKLCLEGFQAGLSWLTILRKRDAFREAFADFDFHRVAKFTERDVNRLLKNAGIVRHRGKIAATINNAQRALELQQEFANLVNYFHQFVPADHSPLQSKDDIVAQTNESKSLSKDLKKRGWAFVGPTTCYAFMQSAGIVNDHIVGCDFNSDSRSQ